jgi:hypothetical protein
VSASLQKADGFGEFLMVGVEGDVVACRYDLIDEFGIDLSNEVKCFFDLVEAVGE